MPSSTFFSLPRSYSFSMLPCVKDEHVALDRWRLVTPDWRHDRSHTSNACSPANDPRPVRGQGGTVDRDDARPAFGPLGGLVHRGVEGPQVLGGAPSDPPSA